MSREPLRWEDAAELRTVPEHQQWTCVKCGRGYGGDQAEEAARYCCHTDAPCKCGRGRARRGWTCCDECRLEHDVERYGKRPVIDWDGETPLYSEAATEWFFSEESIYDHVIEHCNYEEYEQVTSNDIAALRLVVGEPARVRPFDLKDYLHDELPEDGEPPSGWEEAEKAVNKWLGECGVISWQPGSKAVRPWSVVQK